MKNKKIILFTTIMLALPIFNISAMCNQVSTQRYTLPPINIEKINQSNIENASLIRRSEINPSPNNGLQFISGVGTSNQLPAIHENPENNTQMIEVINTDLTKKRKKIRKINVTAAELPEKRKKIRKINVTAAELPEKRKKIRKFNVTA